ncbi:hypothetical protein [uncultured Winogradskyella sp.]|uniref:hypothetical protein n=1 Tax=uncultured Winogradskyella sp. TaxID=395353 RepID=UPI00260472F8|nr:hypothetical protein [uncultured Winogradskyella sp.]
MVNTDKIYQWLRELKASERLSFGKLGSFIDYSDVGFSKAMRNETLSYEQVKIIAKKVNKLKEFEDFVSNYSNFDDLSLEENSKAYEAEKEQYKVKDYKELLDLGLKVVANYEELKKLDIVKNLFKIDILEERIRQQEEEG